MREPSEIKLGKISNMNNANIIIKCVKCENIYLWNKEKIYNKCLESRLLNMNIGNKSSEREEIVN